MTKHSFLSLTAVAIFCVLTVPARGQDGGGRNLRAELSGSREVPTVSSAATGRFRARVFADGTGFEYSLDYDGLEGVVTQAHIHIAQPFASGGISVWLCKTDLVNPPPTVPAFTPICGPGGEDGPEAIGVITAEHVIGPVGQAVPSMAFSELMRLIRSGNAYANVHSTSAPGGEVRGQIEVRSPDDDH